MTRAKFVRNLLNMCSEMTGCSIQHKGCPCNSCFHNFTDKKLKLHPVLGHMFWLVVLGLRGDYSQEELIGTD